MPCPDLLRSLSMHRLALLLLLLAACAAEPQPAADAAASGPPEVTSPAALIGALRARYDGRWYKTLTFVQETIRYDAEGVADTATWHEAYAAPGRLRIDIAPLEDGNGILFAEDVRYTVQNGKVTATRPQIHPLLLLGFDVYHLPAEESLRKLDTLGFDLTKMYETTWQGRPTYVVGAEDEAEKASTFWIDRKRLVFVRMIRYVGPERSNVQEVRFDGYERLGGGWVAPKVRFTFDGQPVLEETYREMRADVPLDTALFNPNSWRDQKAGAPESL